MLVQAQGSAEEDAQQAVLEKLAARMSGHKQPSEEVVTPGTYVFSLHSTYVTVAVAAVWPLSVSHHLGKPNVNVK